MKKGLITTIALFFITASFGQRVDFQEILRLIGIGKRNDVIY